MSRKGGKRRHSASAVWPFPGWLQTCNPPKKNKLGPGACEWLAKLLRGGHLHAVTQWPTAGQALESALELVVAGVGIVFPDEGYKWQSHGLFGNTGFGMGEA